jgi:hypothetical protein
MVVCGRGGTRTILARGASLSRPRRMGGASRGHRCRLGGAIRAKTPILPA